MKDSCSNEQYCKVGIKRLPMKGSNLSVVTSPFKQGAWSKSFINFLNFACSQSSHPLNWWSSWDPNLCSLHTILSKATMSRKTNDQSVQQTRTNGWRMTAGSLRPPNTECSQWDTCVTSAHMMFGGVHAWNAIFASVCAQRMGVRVKRECSFSRGDRIWLRPSEEDLATCVTQQCF